MTNSEKHPVQFPLSRRLGAGGVPLLGINSLASIRKAQRSDDKEKPSSREPAQSMESRSSVDRKEQTPSSVRMTDGDGQTTKNPPSADSTKDSPKKTVRPAKKAVAKKTQPNVRTVDPLDEEDDF